MDRTLFEILLLVPAAFTAGFVMFIAGVVQGVMDDMNEAAFKHFLIALKTRAMRSPYAIAVSTITFVGMFPYFIYYGFSNTWFTAGLILWTVTSIISKVTVLPIYSRVDTLETGNVSGLSEERRKLHNANILRSFLSFASVILMMIGVSNS